MQMKLAAAHSNAFAWSVSYVEWIQCDECTVKDFFFWVFSSLSQLWICGLSVSLGLVILVIADSLLLCQNLHAVCLNVKILNFLSADLKEILEWQCKYFTCSTNHTILQYLSPTLLILQYLLDRMFQNYIWRVSDWQTITSEPLPFLMFSSRGKPRRLKGKQNSPPKSLVFDKN